LKSYKELSITYDDGIAIVTFEQYVLKLDLLTKLALTLYQLEEDAAVNGIVLIGRRNLFLSGADLKEFDALTNGTVARKFIQIPGAMMEQIYQCRKVTVAAINGYCIGGGLELALACDFRFCVDRVENLQGESVPFMGLPEVSLGVVSPLGSSYFLPRLIGQAAAKEIMLTADLFDAEYAYRVGLVHRVVPEEQLAGIASELAKKVASNSLFAVAQAKHLINHSFEKPSLEEGIAAEREAFAACCNTVEKKQRIAAKLKQPKA